MAHAGIITPDFWRTMERKGVSKFPGQWLGAWLLTDQLAGRHLPGLLHVGMASLAEETGLTMSDLEVGLSQLDAAGFLRVDRDRRLIWIPNAPKFGHSPNHQVIPYWWRLWNAIPDSPFKHAHVECLKRALKTEGAESTTKAWDRTFGTVKLAMDGGVHSVPADKPNDLAVLTHGAMGTGMGNAMGGPTHSGTGTGTGTASHLSRPVGPPPAPAMRIARRLEEATAAVSGAELAKWGWEVDRAMKAGATEESLEEAIDFAKGHVGANGFSWKAQIVDAFALVKHLRKLTGGAAAARAAPKGTGTFRVTDDIKYVSGEKKL